MWLCRIVLAAALQLIAQEISSTSVCNISMVQNFDTLQMLGTWYEVMHSGRRVEPEGFGGRCEEINITLSKISSDSIFLRAVVSVFYPWSAGDQKNHTLARLVYNYNSPVNMFSYESSTRPGNYTFNVVYENTSSARVLVVMVCATHNDGTADDEYISVLSSSQELPDELETVMSRALQSLGIDCQLLERNAQNGCPGALEDGPGCPTTPSVIKSDFDIKQYTGSWYVTHYTEGMEWFANPCSSHLFYGTPDALSFFQRNLNKTADKFTTEQGFASVEGNGALRLQVPDLQSYSFLDMPAYWVLDTDYDSYSVVQTCVLLSYNVPLNTAMVLSRDFYTTDRKLDVARRVILEAGFIETSLRPVHHSDCPRDSCPAHWTTKRSLDPVQFAGDWIEALRLGAEEGTLLPCTTYRFTPAYNRSLFVQERVLEMDPDESTEVHLQEMRPLEIIEHDGRYARTTGVDREMFYILGTVYDTWALTAFCYTGSSLGDPVSVSFSILARRTELSRESWNDVEASLTRYQLHLMNGFTANGTSSCPVETCALPMRTMEKFNSSQYLGLWSAFRETPVRGTTGFCAQLSFQPYSPSEGTFNASFTQFYPKLGAYQTESFVMRQINATQGVFAGISNSSGDDITIWVISTDYRRFALVYICANGTGRTQVLGRGNAPQDSDEHIILDALVHSFLDASTLYDVVQGPPRCPPSHLLPPDPAKCAALPGSYRRAEAGVARLLLLTIPIALAARPADG